MAAKHRPPLAALPRPAAAAQAPVPAPTVEWLNYHHLFYFFVVAREGTIARACEILRLAQPTVSGQLRTLEESLGEPLFERTGRRLRLTEVGRTVYGYAEEIFGLGRALQAAVKGSPVGTPLRVGIADTVPKTIAHRLLQPALRMTPPVPLLCTEDKTERLLAELALRDLDLVISDAPLPPASAIRAFNHSLGECGTTFLAHASVQAELTGRFPRSLDGAPMLLPARGTQARRALDAFLTQHEVRPRIVAEFEDTALMKVFGLRGEGVFPVPSIVAEEIGRRYEATPVGTTDEVRERFYAVTAERRLVHPATRHLVETARANGL